MKIEYSVNDVSAVRPPYKAEDAIFEVILALRFFCQLNPYLLPGSHFVMLEPPLEL